MKALATVLLVLIVANLAHSSTPGLREPIMTARVKAPVSIGNLGVQNLVLTISYQPVCDDETLVQTREYENFVTMLTIEMQGIAMQEILSAPYQTLDSLGTLVQAIEAKLKERVDARIAMTFPDGRLRVPVSVSRLEFFSTEGTTLRLDTEGPR